jgi:hypothetical protein
MTTTYGCANSMRTYALELTLRAHARTTVDLQTAARFADMANQVVRIRHAHACSECAQSMELTR